MDLVLATQSKGKIQEIRNLLSDLPVRITTLEERGITEQDPETGTTFEENSESKARNAFILTGDWTLADDAGIVLAGLPDRAGVNTKEWMEGYYHDADKFTEFLRSEFEGVDDLAATFHCVLTLVEPVGAEGVIHRFSGEVPGRIILDPRGGPIPNLFLSSHFIPDGRTNTLAEMDTEEFERYSHRGIALVKARAFLKERFA